jgi:molecular chaperone DnaJ
MPGKDYYEILGVSRAATEEEIRKAFRRLAKQYHPDRNKGDKNAERRFKEANEAYSVLHDKQKRAQYDQFGEARDKGFTGNDFWENMNRRRGRRPGPAESGEEERFQWEDVGDAGDIFSQFFRRESPGGWGARQSGPAQGEDVEAVLEAPFETAISGGKMAISVPGVEPCARCGGSGAQPGTKSQTCPVCHGAGNVQAFQGAFAFSRPCPRCFGRGQVISAPCSDCNGAGQTQRARRFNVSIPRGAQDGQKIRLAGQGRPGHNGGPAGDLYIELRVADHPDFRRKGLDIHSDVHVNIVQAALGARVSVRTVTGQAAVRIPPGTQPGAVLRLKGRGVTSSDGVAGDHYVTVHVDVPARLSPRQAELLREFANESGLPAE